MDLLGDKLGPLLFQFAYFNKKAFLGVNDFLARLLPFLKKLPKDHRFAVELRNKKWLVPQFVETLRGRGVALALIDQSWMPRPAQWFEKFDPITADFKYVRFLGDRTFPLFALRKSTPSRLAMRRSTPADYGGVRSTNFASGGNRPT
jgi:uncharacterized protein YecE (DUF72 family)